MRLSISQKLSLAPLAVALFFALLCFGYLLPEVDRSVERYGQEVGAMLPRTLAVTLARPLTERQDALVKSTIEPVVQGEAVAYVAVFGPDGRLVAASGRLGQSIRERPMLLTAGSEPRGFQLSKQQVVDFQTPITGGGRVHVGLGRTDDDSRVRSITTRFSLVVIAALAAFSLGGLLFSRRLVAPLRELTDAANRIAQGDVTQTVRVTSQDEVGQLAGAFSTMADRLKHVLQQMQSSSKLLATSVEGLNSSADEQNQMVSRQAAALQETQVTAQEIRQTSVLASQTADSVLKVAERADELGRTGEAAITASIQGLEGLRDHVLQITERIVALSTRTEQISGITETVKSLADQSNLLAVNAAIEAARSGEQGKGFAVVAREIRALADQSIRATNQVREILVDISSAIASTVNITQEGMMRMEEGLAQVRTSGDNLRELSTIVRDNAAAVRQIAHAVSQQNSGIEQIFTAVNDLNQLMMDTVHRISRTTDSALSLKALSEQVSEVVRDYQV
jgi:methyl-accepting chemotaxis protein